jgi:phage N-6-adenine-methyltransferase
MNSGLFTSNDDTWRTPRKFFDELDREFDFKLDVAALSSSALCPEWYGPDHHDVSRRDALVMDWLKDSGGGAIYMNPPYGRQIKHWVKKANDEARGGATVVCLVPARTDTSWWHENCIMHEVRFIRGRIHFSDAGPAPFPSAVIVMRGKHD